MTIVSASGEPLVRLVGHAHHWSWQLYVFSDGWESVAGGQAPRFIDAYEDACSALGRYAPSCETGE